VSKISTVLVPLLLMLLTPAQESVAATSPVSVGHLSFEPADLSVSYEQVVPLGTTYYKTQIVWRFSDGTLIEEPLEVDWFFYDGFACIAAVAPVNPLSAQTLVPSTPERPARYVRKLKEQPPIGSVLIDAEVRVVASILSDGNSFGEAATVRQVFRHRQALSREYDFWLKVFAGAWQDDSAIATLRTIVPLLQRSRPDALGEKVRLTIKPAAEAMLHASERDLSDAPRLLNGLVGVIEQQRNFLRDQAGK
jgi:hypothetical protein